MNFTSFFIKNPVFAIVLNTMLVVVGILSFGSLHIREYPQIEIPMVIVSAMYQNASPEVIESAITNVLEDELAGVEGVDTVASWSSSGNSTISLKFLENTSMDKAIASVRDALNKARDRLPREVKEPAIYRNNGRKTWMPFMLLALESETMNSLELNHFANMMIKNTLRSLDGVSSVSVWGEEYVVKVNVDHKKLHMFGINVDEICRAIGEENIFRPLGKVRNVTSATLESELKSIEDFENIIVKHQNFSYAKNKKRAIFLKDIAAIELSSDDKNSRSRINGKKATFIAIELASDANPIEVSNLVQKEIKKLEKEMTAKVSFSTILDNAEFVRNSIKNIAQAITEAILLVLIVVFIFLKSVRAIFVPIMTIPVSLVGMILFLKIFGFSINIMTLLGVALAIGLVVDDAIVVLENISRHIENGMSKIEASLKGAKEIGPAIVAMTLTIVSVYMPFVFVGGTIGHLFIEFAVALAGSVLISGLVALTLSPLMCSVLLEYKESRFLLHKGEFFRRFTEKYNIFLAQMLPQKKIALAVTLCSLIATGMFLATLSKETAPKEDRGIVQVYIPTLYGKDANYYENQGSKISSFLREMKEIKYYINFTTENNGFLFLPLIEKTKRQRSAQDIVADLSKKVQNFPSQDVYVWSEDSNLPGISGSERSSRIAIVIATNGTYQDLYENLEKVKNELLKNPIFENPTHNLNFNNFVYKIHIDAHKVSKLGITKGQISSTLEVFFSGNRNFTFHKDGIPYRVFIDSSEKPWDLSGIYITNASGQKISMATIAKMVLSTEPSEFYHRNQMRSAELSFDLSRNADFCETLDKAMKILDDNLPQSYKKIPIGVAEFIDNFPKTMLLLFFLAIVFVFAILSLQFNNFKDSFLVLLTIPFACFGALFSIWITGISLNIYTFVGLVTLIGLITKHGILIVEFTNQLMAEGESVASAVRRAATIRLRPILITTGAMFFGAIPLVISGDYGCESRGCIGIILTGGLFFGTIFVLTIFPILCNFFKNGRSTLFCKK
ncbi:MAG: efflux RND transporter permease subunit [Holosporaceae bacterium]|jgi:multidrug efflux pump|nr:efflux RND transporter permease subunit [Holosporaceae bacterium]